jgi:glycosyltransferase involved in cell wall biosynthesis
VGAGRISIIIPTQRRPGPLALATASVLAQEGVDRTRLELVIADNDQQPSASALAEMLRETARFPVRYVHEPKAGVANVRNAALASASGEMIAYLDDHQQAPARWLEALLNAQARWDADVVFGPVRGRTTAARERDKAYLERFFSRPGIGYRLPTAGPIGAYFGCGNSLLRRSALPGPHPFDVRRNHIGGEDDLLFATMQRAGARFAWAPEAWVWEDPAHERQSLSYALARAFAYGQGPTVAAATAGRRALAARWMATGAVQAALFGAVATVALVFRRRDAPFWMDRAARGLGKVLWWERFKIRFYGRSSPGDFQTSEDA